MSSFNRVILMGNVTRDPELRYIPSGTAVVDLSLAVNDRRRQGDGSYVDEAHFFDVTIWARKAEIAAQYLSKGSPVLIEGRLRQERWEKDGQKFSKVKVICDNMQLLRGSGNAGGGGGNAGGGGNYQQNTDYQQSGGGNYQQQEPPQQDDFGAPPPSDGDIPF